MEEMTGGPLSQMSEAVNNIDKIKSEDSGNGSAKVCNYEVRLG
jgi:hypothetical protein